MSVTRAATRMPLRATLILTAYALSGSAGLVYEVIWQRSLALIVGSTTAATAAVLAVFLGGLALGSCVFGRMATTRVRRALLLYAVLELAIASLAALLIPVWSHANWWSAFVWRLAGDSGSGALAARLAVTGLLLLPPATLMGGTFPVLARYRPQQTLPGLWVPALYAVNTLGAGVGALGAGFLLLPALGTRGATLVAMGLNGAAAAVALLLATRAVRRTTAASEAVGVAEVARSARADAPAVVWAVLALSGAVTLAFEVVWTRTLTLVLGSSTFAFATMLATYIGGLAIGALAGAQIAPRLSRPLTCLGWIQVLTAAGALVALHLVPQLPVAFLYVFRFTGDDPLALTLGMSALAAAIMFPTAVSQGMVFPLGVHLLATGAPDAGARAGTAYAVSTVGAVAGALVATFWLIPGLGIDGAGGAVAAASLVAAGLLVLSGSRPRGRPAGFAAEGAVTVTALALVLFFPRWDPLRLGTGVYRDAPHLLGLYASPRDFPRILEHYRPLFYRDGAGASVLVYERPSLAAHPHRVLAINGKVEASTADDMPTQVLSGHVPLMVGAQPGRALIVGVASGITLGALARHRFREIVAVEIEPAVLEAARAFRDFNHDVLADPRVRLIVEDGRSFLAGGHDRFEVIVSEPSNPWVPGSARLFTFEFFQLVRRRLREHGVFVQWIQMYGLEPELLRTVVRTFQAAFPEVLAIRPSEGDLLLVGAARPIRLDYTCTSAILADPDVAPDLNRIGIHKPADVAIRLAIAGADVRSYAGSGALNTDDNALVEFGASRGLYRNTIVDNSQALAAHAPPVPLTYIEGLGQTSEQRAQAGRAMARAYLRARQWIPAYRAAKWSVEQQPTVEGWWLAGEAASQLGDLREARQAWLEGLGFDRAHPPTRVGLARIAWRGADPNEAERMLEPLLRANPAKPPALYLGGLLAARRGDHAAAVRLLTAALSVWPDVSDRWVVRYVLLWARRVLGGEAVAAAEQRRMVEDLKAWCALLEGTPHLPGDGPIETEAILDAIVFDRAGVTSLMARHVFDPLNHFYRGKTLYLLGYRAEAVAELERAVERGGCNTAREYLARARESDGRPD